MSAALPLLAGTSLTRGTRYWSPSGGHYLAFEEGQKRDVVVRSSADTVVWSLSRVFRGSENVRKVLVQEADGNLVARDENGKNIWSALNQPTGPRTQLTITRRGALQLVGVGDDVRWSSDGDLTGDPLPDHGWTQIRTIRRPRITIMATASVTSGALDAVVNIYTDMTDRLSLKYPASRMDGFRVYVTNGGAWSEIGTLQPVGSMWPTVDSFGVVEGDELRGGANFDYLWIDEQMIDKTGVVTRNQAYAKQKRATRDDQYRGFDQVIHEFAHSIDARNSLRPRIDMIFKHSALNSTPAEAFAAAVQRWFGHPVGDLAPDEQAFLEEVFDSRVTYSVPDGRPVAQYPDPVARLLGAPKTPDAPVSAASKPGMVRLRFDHRHPTPSDTVFAYYGDVPHFAIPGGSVYDIETYSGTKWTVRAANGDEILQVSAPATESVTELPGLAYRFGPDSSIPSNARFRPEVRPSPIPEPPTGLIRIRLTNNRSVNWSAYPIVVSETNLAGEYPRAVERAVISAGQSVDLDVQAGALLCLAQQGQPPLAWRVPDVHPNGRLVEVSRTATTLGIAVEPRLGTFTPKPVSRPSSRSPSRIR